MPNFWIILIIIFSSLLKGVTGFGFALFSFPLLLMWYAPKEIIPVLMVCNFITSFMIVLQKKEQKLLDRSSYLLIGSGGIFTVLGVLALSSSDGKLLIHISGVIFLILVLYTIIQKKPKANKQLKQKSYLIAGGLIGFLTGAISVSGPPLAIFLNRANVSNRKFREIFAAFSLVTAFVAIIGYYHAEILTKQTMITSLYFAPILLGGTILGKKLNSWMSIKSFQTINIILTAISSLLLIVL